MTSDVTTVCGLAFKKMSLLLYKHVVMVFCLLSLPVTPDLNTRLRHYEQLLAILPDVNYATLKKIVLHLVKYVIIFINIVSFSFEIILY